MLSLTVAALVSPAIFGACAKTFGAPKDDYYDTESATQAMEDEEEEDASEDANR